jgi:hypothetical protein
MAQPVFTDPQSMRQKLADAHGSDVWDNFSMLSPERAEQQINALSSNEPFVPLRGLYDSNGRRPRPPRRFLTGRSGTVSGASENRVKGEIFPF